MSLFTQIASLWSDLLTYDLDILRYINVHRFRPADGIFKFITDTTWLVSVCIPVIMLIVALIQRKQLLRKTSYLIILSLLAATVITTSLKYAVNRVRPFITHSDIEKLTSGGSPSFPSGHTSDAFVTAAAVTLFATRRRTYVGLVWVWAFTVAYTRIVLGVHYPSDVLMSMIVGISSAFIVRYIFKKPFAN